MGVEINLRHDQSKSDVDAARSSDVCIYAPSWVSEGLKIIGKQFAKVPFRVVDNDHKMTVLEKFTLDESVPISLIQLQKIALADRRNVWGQINLARYKNLIEDETIFSLKDLVRQCVTVGLDETTHYGGYPHRFPVVPQVVPVYVCSLIGLQFQQRYNSGRLVLYSSDEYTGVLDEFIFRNVVGESRNNFGDVKRTVESGDLSRYRKGDTNDVYFDAVAYSRFVAHDVVLTGLAVNDMAAERNHRVHFKFLKYGSGFFAGKYGLLIEELILPAVVDGLEKLFRSHRPQQIASLEFPFYTEDAKSGERLQSLCEQYGLKCSFGFADALMHTIPDKSCVLATTNCADSQVVAGNAMGRGSLDGAIATNLRSKGNIFSACLNGDMREKFVDL